MRTALVTGSSRGIGKAIALKLGEEGYFVIVNYRKRREEAEKTLKELREKGSDGITIQADVGDPKQVDEMFQHISEISGGVDVLVNNAGWGFLTPVAQMEDSLWERHIRVNLNSVFYVTKRALPYMINKHWGRIVNISSIAGIRGLPGLSAYSAAKAGVIVFTKTLAQELAGTGITVNSVAIGFSLTDMGESFFKATGISVEEYSRKYTLTGRLVDPSEVASLVSYLVSEESRNITGQVFVIDSGQLLAGVSL